LGWTGQNNMLQLANPKEEAESRDFSAKQTVEFRCPDGSADVYLLLAGLTVAARHGLESEDSLDFAHETYVDVNIFDDEHKHKVDHLNNCLSLAMSRQGNSKSKKPFTLKYDVFDKKTIEGIVKNLLSFQGCPHQRRDWK
jgi:glutamine synthetase